MLLFMCRMLDELVDLEKSVDRLSDQMIVAENNLKRLQDSQVMLEKQIQLKSNSIQIDHDHLTRHRASIPNTIRLQGHFWSWLASTNFSPVIVC